MDDLSLNRLRSNAAFALKGEMTMADIRRQAETDASLTSNQRRDLLSAFNRLAKLFGLPLDTIPASPRRVQGLFASKSPAQLELSEKTFANLRSLISKALLSYSKPDQCLTKRIPPTPEWQVLLDRIDTDHVRWGLYRLAAYCSAMGIRPEAVTSQTLIGLLEAVEAEEIVKQPKVTVSQTISHWNRSMRRVPGWPQTTLAEPMKKPPMALSLTAFPTAFQEDVEAWRHRHAAPDPFDDDAPPKPLRPVTIDHRIYTFRQFASALVGCGHFKIEDIISIRMLLEPDAFKAGIRVFLERTGTTSRVHNMARTLRLIGKHYCRLDEPTLAALEKFCRRLDPGGGRQLTERNRRRLGQFDDPSKVHAMLTFPEKEERYARSISNPLRAAKAMERAVAVSLLIYAAPRIETLRTLQLSDFTFLASGCCLLTIPAGRMKMGRTLELNLNEEVTALLQRHIKEYRPGLAGSQGPCLFPGQDGGPRAKTALYIGLVRALRQRGGLEMNPHLFRHAIAKIAVEEDPDAYLAVSRVLGHTSLDTTMGHYLGTESKAAGRHMDALFKQVKGRFIPKTSKRG